MSKVSVIVPCYKQGRFLAEALESLTAQTLADWECVVADDGSPDESYAVGLRFAGRDARFKAITKPNTGKSSTLNWALSYCDPASCYLFVLDSDDMLTPDALETMSSYLDNHPQVGMVGCQFSRVAESGAILGPGHRSRIVPGFPLPRDLRDDEAETPFISFFCGTGQGAFAMYRRAVLSRAGGWDEQFANREAFGHEDTDMFCRMALIAPVHYLPGRYYLVREHPTSATRTPGNKAYDLFRAKWDHYDCTDGRTTRLIARSRRHYYRTHRPLRHIRVGLKAARELAASPRLRTLNWCVECLSRGLSELVLARLGVLPAARPPINP
jgi:glycosyltransferase involved in cell wall biosynthesis